MRRFARALGILYVVALVVTAVSLRFVGERLWVTTIALYLPRLGFLLPMPFLAGLLVAAKERRLALGVAVVSSLLVVVVLMRVKPFGRHEAQPGSIRVMTWNTFLGRLNNEQIRTAVTEENPDVFVSQATAHRTKELFRAAPEGFTTLESDDEFFLATRYKLVEKYVPPEFADDTNHRPNFVRYTLETPGGLVDLVSMHPRSPRSGIEKARGEGLKSRMQDAGLVEQSISSIDQNTALRRRQVLAAVDAVRGAKHPVIVAGDTNLPTLSELFHEAFDGLGLHDGFDEAGSGFGYTFPAKRPWMRIDRVLADEHFRFLGFHEGHVLASDHHYVVADLAARQ